MADKGFFLYKEEARVPRDVIHVKIDASAKIIDDEAFKNCKQLRTVDFSDAKDLVMISEEAFAGCVSLKEADLTALKGLRFIYHKAFQGCISLKILGKLPANLDRIGESAFDPGEDRETEKLDIDFSSAEQLRFIYAGAFANCKFEKEIKIPEELEAIAEKAFEASSMPGIDFSDADSLRFIGKSAFSESRIESKVQLPPMLETIDDHAFEGSTAPAMDFSLAAWLQKIGASAFADCKFDNEIRLPARLETLGEEAFSGTSMQRLDLSRASRLRIVDRWCFARCNIEKDVKFSSTLEGISQRSFTGSSIQRLDFSLAESLRVIGHGAFAGCTIQQEVQFPPGLEEIFPRAFAQARTSAVNLSMCKKQVLRQSVQAFDGCLCEKMIGSMGNISLGSMSLGSLDELLSESDEDDGDKAEDDSRGLDEAAEQVSPEASEPVTDEGVDKAEDDSQGLDAEATEQVSPEASEPVTEPKETPELEEKAPESPDNQKVPLPSSNDSLVKNSGWLEKKSRSMFLQPVWERRYFVLQDGVLTYSRNKFFGDNGVGDTGVKTKSLSNVVVERNGAHYEVRDRDSSKILLTLRLPEQGSSWDPKHSGMASTVELSHSMRMEEEEETSRSISHVSLLGALPEQPSVRVIKLDAY